MLGRYKSEESYKKVTDAQAKGILTRKKKFYDERRIYYENPINCIYCNNPIPYENRNTNKFCSSSCSAIYNNLKRGKNKTCINCGNNIKKGASKYCSRFCNIEYNTKKKNISIENNETVSNGALRKYLMEKHHSKCQQCGWGIPNPISNTVCLDMHHIDGDYKNSVLSNVELLCPNCHTLTPNYKRVGKKRKSTRTFRNK